jgi:hypothetical protein
MPWWGSEGYAMYFAELVGISLGRPGWVGGKNLPGANYLSRFTMYYGSFFAFIRARGDYDFVRYEAIGSFSNSYALELASGGLGLQEGSTGSEPCCVWAQATLVPPAKVPGPLPAVGLPVAFGFSRQLRKRIKASASNPPNASAEA